MPSSAPDITSFEIFLRDRNRKEFKYKSVSNETTSVKIKMNDLKNLRSGDTTVVRVRAVNMFGQGELSEV